MRRRVYLPLLAVAILCTMPHRRVVNLVSADGVVPAPALASIAPEPDPGTRPATDADPVPAVVATALLVVVPLLPTALRRLRRQTARPMPDAPATALHRWSDDLERLAPPPSAEPGTIAPQPALPEVAVIVPVDILT